MRYKSFIFNQCYFPFPWPGFYLCFAFLGSGSGGIGLFVKQFDGLADSCVMAPLTCVVFFYPAGNIGGSACVKGIVATLNDICIPHDIYSTKDKKLSQLIYSNVNKDFFSLL